MRIETDGVKVILYDRVSGHVGFALTMEEVTQLVTWDRTEGPKARAQEVTKRIQALQIQAEETRKQTDALRASLPIEYRPLLPNAETYFI